MPTNIKVILEGEEEIGSKHLDGFIRDHRGDLEASVVVISDSPMFDRGVPSICYGLRGLTYFQIDFRGTTTDLHSGSFGGAVANPAFVLSQVLGQMKDRGGRVKIPGFYNDVRLGAAPQLMVISGSNMSGKTTLLRTVGVNAVLAWAGAPVRAAALQLSPVAVGGTLRVQDSLLAGQSRFYTEILRVKQLVEMALISVR